MLAEEEMSARTPVGTIKPDSKDVSLFSSPDSFERVSPGDSLTVSSWWGGLCLICNGLASLPLQVWRDNASGGQDHADQHPVNYCLEATNNGWQTPSVFKSLLQACNFLAGNSVADIKRNSYGQCEKITPWLPEFTHFGVDGNNEPVYGVTGVLPQIGLVVPNSGRNFVTTPQWLPYTEVLHIKNFSTNGYLGISTLYAARSALRTGIARNQFGQRTFEKGRPAGFFTKDGMLGDAQRKLLKEEWKEMNEGPLNSFNIGILSNGIGWQSMGYTADDAQFVQSSGLSVLDFCRFLNIPPPLLGDLTNSSDGKIIELMLYFLQHTLLPWIIRWEEELNLKLFTPRERPKYRARFNLAAFLRGDILTAAKVNEIQIRNGIRTLDEIRLAEHHSPYPDGSGSKPLIIASQLDTLANVASGKSQLTMTKAPQNG